MGSDPQLIAFLASQWFEIDSRAGNDSELFKTDEDYTEGAILTRSAGGYASWCDYQEGMCGPFCSKDHFHPPLAFPLAGKDATVHAREYFDMAVKLYKAAKCGTDGRGQTYYRWAAMALGHAIHLVEDMGSPQHGYPENHMPLAGHGPSFFELWTQDLWDTKVLWNNPAGGMKWLGQYEISGAAKASSPLRGTLEGIMETHKHRAQQFALSTNPRRPGTLRLLDAPNSRDDAKGDVSSLAWRWSPSPDDVTYRLDHMTADTFPIWAQYAVQDHSVHLYLPDHYDFWTNPSEAETPSADGAVAMGIASVEMALRFWADAAPPSFEDNTQELMKGTTEAAAGAILAFWDEVKDFECTCWNFTPCDFGRGQSQPNCDDPPNWPYSPGRDAPDDTPGVVTLASTAVPEPPEVFDAADHARFWNQIAAVGVEKGIRSLVDYGRAMRLVELAADRRLDGPSKTAVAEGVVDLERKYTVHRRRPEDDMGWASHVGILAHGFAGQAGDALEKLGWLPTPVEVAFDPLTLAERIEVLLIPSGGLFGMGESIDLRQRLASFVEAGGTLLVLAQMRGADFGAVPVPAGEALAAHGWFEDASCWLGSVAIAARHPITAALGRGGNTVAVDGSLIRWPSQSTVLLRKVGGGAAAMVAYPMGDGWVVASTIFSDWGLVNGRDSMETRGLFQGLLRWGVDPGQPRPDCHANTGCSLDLTLSATNLTEVAADTVEWVLRAPQGKRLAAGTKRLALAPGSSLALPVHVELPPGADEGLDALTGIGTLSYRLLDGTRPLTTDEGGSEPWEVQPWGTVGQFVMDDFSAEVTNLPQVGVAIAVDTEYWLPGAQIPLHLTVRNFGGDEFAGSVRFWSVRGGGCCRQDYGTASVTVAAGSVSEVDWTVGPVGMNEGHAGEPGGATIFAEVLGGGATSVATASKGVLNNPTFLDLDLQSSHEHAGAGDELEFSAFVANSSMGTVTARHKVVVETHYNSSGVPCPRVGSGWREFTVDKDSTFTFVEPYIVPAGCIGLIQASVLLCYPGMQCWDNGLEHFARLKRFPPVALPGSRVELTFGEFETVPGPAVRLPVRVRNVGLRPVEEGVLELSWEGPSGSVASAPFDLVRGDETTIALDVPIDGRRLPLVLTVRAIASDRSGTMAYAFHSVRYGGGLAAVTGFAAPAGSDAVSGTLEIANRSSATRTFSLDLSAPELEYHRTEELAIGPSQRVSLAVRVPLPLSLPFGSWVLAVSAGDGALLDAHTTTRVVHASPRVQIASRPEAPSYRAGETASILVTLTHGELARPVPGTLELSCEPAGLVASRAVTLDPLHATQETFAVPLPSTIAAGAAPFTVRWLGPYGDTAGGTGTIVVPPARFAVRLVADSVAAGGTVEYDVNNTGGAAGDLVATWVLTSGEQTLAGDSATAPLQPGERARLSFSLPPTLATGPYLGTLWYDDATGPGWRSDVLHVSGLTTALTVATGSPSYTVGQVVDTVVGVLNGALDFPAAQLDLAIVAPAGSCTRVRPWGTFQGASSREGACADGGALFADPDLDWRFDPTAALSAAVTPVAVAAGDLDEDGRGDVVAALPHPGELELALFTGSNLRRASSTSVPAAAAASMGVFDADGDGRLEVYLTTANDGALLVRAFNRWLQPLWETAIEVAGVVNNSFPAGGPILADFGEARALLVSAGSDVVAFDPMNGCVGWRLSSRTSGFDGWLVTGIASVDVDSDGSGEVAVGFRRPGVPSTGAVALLTDSGAVIWVHETTNAVAATPAVVAVPEQGFRVAAVETPDDATGPSTLLLLDAASGALVSRTNAAFRTTWGPAAGDTNGDGLPELAVASSFPEECEACPHQAQGMLFALDGSLLWSSVEWGAAAGPPIMMDVDGDRRLDVLAPYKYGDGAFVACWRGDSGDVLAGGASTALGPIYVVDIDGDCLPELFVGDAVLKARERRPSIAARRLGAGGDGEVIWQWSDWANLAGGETWEVSPFASTDGRTGLFKVVGELTSQHGQTVARAESTFSVVPGDVALTLQSPPENLQPGTRTRLAGAVRNDGAASLDLDLVVSVNDVTIAGRTVSLANGETLPFDEPLTLSTPGPHKVRVEAIANGDVLASLLHLVLVQQPDVVVALSGPDAVGQEEFVVLADLANPTGVEVSLEVGLDADGQPESPRQSVHIAGGDTVTLVFRRSIGASTRFVLRTSGDVRVEKTLDVGYDIRLAPVYVGAKVLPAGSAVLTVDVTNNGSFPWTGELSWRLAGASDAAGSAALVVGGGATTRLDLPVTLHPGPSGLRVATGDASDEVLLSAYVSGLGVLEVAVPSVAIEGEATAQVRLTNLVSTLGSFAVELDIRAEASGAVVATERRSWALEGAESVQEVVPLTVPLGRYVLSCRLNGEPNCAGNTGIEVVEATAVEIAASLGTQTEDGTLSVLLAVRNTGARDVAGMLRVHGLPWDWTTPIPGIIPAGTAETVMQLQPDTLPPSDLPLAIEFALASGEVIATDHLVVPIRPATLALTAAPRRVDAMAGGLAEMEFTITNAGTQSSQFVLSLRAGDGSVFSEEQRGYLAGGQQRTVVFTVAIPYDLPSADLEAAFRLDAVDAVRETAQAVAVGRFPIAVAGLPVHVEAALDRDHVAPGETVTLTLTVTADAPLVPLTLTLHVAYPPFDARRDVVLTGDGAVASFEVPIGEPGGELGFGVTFASGRSFFLDAMTIHPGDGDVVLTGTPREVNAGEALTLAAELGREGTLELRGFGQEHALAGSGSVTFPVPGDQPRGIYPITWTFYGSGPDGVVNGSYPVRVRGPWVRIVEARMDPARVAAGEASVLQAAVTTDAAVSGEARVWLVDGDGASRRVAVVPLQLGAGEMHELSIPVVADVERAGTHRCVIGLYGASGALVSEASASLDIDGGTLLGVSTEHDFLLGAPATVTALVDVQGVGRGSLLLLLDGVAAATRSLELAGLQRVSIPIADVEPGRHELAARLVVAGLETRATTTFRVGTALADLTVELSAGPSDGRAVAVGMRIRNIGAGTAGATGVELWKGDPESGIRLTGLAVEPLESGEARWLAADVPLPEGTHELVAVVNGAGTVTEHDTANNIARLAVTVAEDQGPGPGPISVATRSALYTAGEQVWVSGSAPDGSYCLSIVPNGVWTVGQPAPSVCVAREVISAAAGTLAPLCVWHAATPGAYDVLVTGPGCPENGPILAALDSGAAPAFQVEGEAIPLFGFWSGIVTTVLIGALGAWVLRQLAAH